MDWKLNNELGLRQGESKSSKIIKRGFRRNLMYSKPLTNNESLSDLAIRGLVLKDESVKTHLSMLLGALIGFSLVMLTM